MSDAWILDSVEEYLRSPLWGSPIMTFIESNCQEFEDSEENKLSYTQIHKDYTLLVDALIENFLSDLGISLEQFEESFHRLSMSERTRKKALMDQILSANDYLMFKNMMVQSNARLQLETLSLASGVSQLPPTQTAAAVGSAQDVQRVSSPQMDDEDALLAMVLEMSRKDHEESQARRQEMPGGDLKDVLEQSMLEYQEALQKSSMEQALLVRAIQASLDDDKDRDAAERLAADMQVVDVTAKETAQQQSTAVTGSHDAQQQEKDESSGSASTQRQPAPQKNEASSAQSDSPVTGQTTCDSATPSAAASSQSNDQKRDESLEERTRHLKELRHQLLQKKKKLRVERLDDFTKPVEEGEQSRPKSRPKSAQAARSATALGSLPPIEGRKGSRASKALLASIKRMSEENQ